MKDIVYNSNTGFTKRYAEMLSQATGLKAYALKDAYRALPKDTHIIYLSWIMGNTLPQIGKVSSTFYLGAIGAVGLNPSELTETVLRTDCGLPNAFPMFLLPGGLKLEKLNLFHRVMLKMVEKQTARKVRKAVRPSEDSLLFLDQLRNGCDMVSGEALAPMAEWANGWKELP